MFTRNYLKFKQAQFCGQINVTVKNTSGTESNYTVANLATGDLGAALHHVDFNYTITGSSVYPSTLFGSGGTPPTLDDYKLESYISSGYTVECGSTSVTKEEDGKYVVWTSFSVTNTSSADMTIREIGYFTATNKGQNNNANVLFERTVLDEPVVIAPSDKKLITYKIVINQTQ